MSEHADIILESVYDQAWAGLEEGQVFPVYWNGLYYIAGGLTWSAERLREEIEMGYWRDVTNDHPTSD